MSALDHQEAWEMKPRKLSVEEIEHPEKVIEAFFQYAHLPQIRWYYWEGLKTLITGTFVSLKSKERSNLIFFYEQLEKLIEIVHVIYEKDLQKK